MRRPSHSDGLSDERGRMFAVSSHDALRDAPAAKHDRLRMGPHYLPRAVTLPPSSHPSHTTRSLHRMGLFYIGIVTAWYSDPSQQFHLYPFDNSERPMDIIGNGRRVYEVQYPVHAKSSYKTGYHEWNTFVPHNSRQKGIQSAYLS
jgi:hypothetical protein